MPDFAAPVEKLIEELKRLPGVGQKTAQRLAFFLLRARRDEAIALADAIREAKEKIRECSICNNITDTDPCLYCAGPSRNRKTICVVEEPHNILPIETTRSFHGLYHILHGAISPLRGIGPEQLKIKGLLDRIGEGTAKEIILATNPTVEGEATAVYLSRLLKPLGVKVTRIAMGIPVGSDLEFADEVTMLKSLENRREM
jgi:recombination protein RecR